MLWLERQVVDGLSTTTEPAARAAVVEWVDGSLQTMPEHLRAGVALGSLVLALWALATGARGARLVAMLERSPLPPVQLHLRLLRSLVLFGDVELGGAPR